VTGLPSWCFFLSQPLPRTTGISEAPVVTIAIPRRPFRTFRASLRQRIRIASRPLFELVCDRSPLELSPPLGFYPTPMAASREMPSALALDSLPPPVAFGKNPWAETFGTSPPAQTFGTNPRRETFGILRPEPLGKPLGPFLWIRKPGPSRQALRPRPPAPSSLNSRASPQAQTFGTL
jgi:hypothetical protein